MRVRISNHNCCPIASVIVYLLSWRCADVIITRGFSKGYHDNFRYHRYWREHLSYFALRFVIIGFPLWVNRDRRHKALCARMPLRAQDVKLPLAHLFRTLSCLKFVSRLLCGWPLFLGYRFWSPGLKRGEHLNSIQGYWSHGRSKNWSRFLPSYRGYSYAVWLTELNPLSLMLTNLGGWCKGVCSVAGASASAWRMPQCAWLCSLLNTAAVVAAACCSLLCCCGSSLLLLDSVLLLYVASCLSGPHAVADPSIFYKLGAQF